MPYKNKEDRTEAVRRHRVKKKEEEGRIQQLETQEKTVCDILVEDMGFEAWSFSEFVGDVQKDLVVKKGGVWSKTQNAFIGEPRVLNGFNTVVLIDVPHISRK